MIVSTILHHVIICWWWRMVVVSNTMNANNQGLAKVTVTHKDPPNLRSMPQPKIFDILFIGCSNLFSSKVRDDRTATWKTLLPMSLRDPNDMHNRDFQKYSSFSQTLKDVPAERFRRFFWWFPCVVRSFQKFSEVFKSFQNFRGRL